MVEKARENTQKGNYTNVEFRLGEIEDLPVADNSVDIIISNCVINLSPEKERVFKDAYRVLKPGGRLMVSDVVLTKPLPKELRDNMDVYVGCVSGADVKEDYLNKIEKAGFGEVEIVSEVNAGELFSEDTDDLGLTKDVTRSIVSVQVSGKK